MIDKLSAGNEVVSSNSTPNRVKVSVIIKALNEEKRIGTAIQTSLKAVEAVGGEVILADSLSSDGTVEIAKSFPIKIVQLVNPADRCCGVGPQLGFQHSCGEYVYILDADMELSAGFMSAAVCFLDDHPEYAGVGGLMREMNTDSLEYVARAERGLQHMKAGDVDRLHGGGLYRRSDIERIGYFSDLNLHSYEEFDLATRLTISGRKLHRLDMHAFNHYGHDVPPYELLLRRWRSRYILGIGELMRASLGQRRFGLVLTGLKEIIIYIATLVWLTLCVVSALVFDVWSLKVLALISFVLVPVGLMSMRKKSIKKGLFSFVSWCFNAAGMLRGLMRSRKDPYGPIPSVVLHDGTR